MTNVEALSIESDERGFELHLTVTDDPIVDEQGRMTLNIHSVAVDLLAAVERTIAPWHREGMSVLAEMRAAGAFSCDPDEGYSRDDPKHSQWHSVHADHYDNREKC